MNSYYYTVLFFLGSIILGWSQRAQVEGVVLNNQQLPVLGVLVSDLIGNSTRTNEFGYYNLHTYSEGRVSLTFGHENYQTTRVEVAVEPLQTLEFNVVLMTITEELNEIIIHKGYENRDGTIVIAPELLRTIPGANAGVENLLKTLPGVNSNNELSTQYAVRGGNYDENLVYVNEIEVYRPFLIRSGQQEGLSFINAGMISNIAFSSGGFQAKYGDKLSSVLDISYRDPEVFGAELEGSFLGATATVDLVSKDKKWTAVNSIRYRNNKMLVNSQDTETNFSPKFLDFQTSIIWKASPKLEWNFIGNATSNTYQYEPVMRQTNFGTIDQPTALLIHYQGQEVDRYKTLFGAVKGDFNWSETTTLKWITAAYQAQEQEYYDIEASYHLGEIETDLSSNERGEVTYSRGVGSQLNHARNNYDALIFNTELKGIHKIQNNQIDWGIKYSREDIKDRLIEWEIIDSAGYVLPDPTQYIKNDQPYEPYTGPLVPYQNVRAFHSVTLDRVQFFGQWNYKRIGKQADSWFNIGIRGHYWQMTERHNSSEGKLIFSPRAQWTLKPIWKKDMLFRLAVGLYQQPPSYREYRDMNGALTPNLKAQKSWHFTLSHDYSFEMWNQPFKLMTEVYYKKLTDVNPYTLDNVRIRYQAHNEAEAYVYGADVRLYGAFVAGTESWLSLGYLKTEENIQGKGFIARPTDQRLKVGLLFQDYMPAIPNLKMYLNLVYNTGMPGGSPSYADPYVYQNRLKDYRRADAGFSYVFKDYQIGQDKKWLKEVENLSLGFEIYNLFDNQNAITNTWVRDVYSKMQYGIPNYMTSRTFNLKLNLKI